MVTRFQENTGSNVAIGCQNLSIAYNKSPNQLILNNISCQINLGEFVAVLGLNGAGKSSWLRCLAGLVPIQQGTIQILGHELLPRNYKQIRQHLSMIVQGGGLMPQLSVLDNVLCGCLGRYSNMQTWAGFPAREQDRALELLQSLGITNKAHALAKQLSGGQQQRVAIARALMQNASILLADEPINGLDVLVAKQVMDELAKLNQERGMTIMAVLHDLEIASTYARRAIIFDRGKVFYDGPTQDLADRFTLLQAAQLNVP
jgi:phosphonate transport system ATP-binding protein